MFNEINDFIIGYSAMFRDVLRLAADEYIGLAYITPKPLRSARWQRLRCGGSMLQEFPEQLSLMLSLTEHFQTQLNDECSCHIILIIGPQCSHLRQLELQVVLCTKQIQLWTLQCLTKFIDRAKDCVQNRYCGLEPGIK